MFFNLPFQTLFNPGLGFEASGQSKHWEEVFATRCHYYKTFLSVAVLTGAPLG
jgi:hypothetical protein